MYIDPLKTQFTCFPKDVKQGGVPKDHPSYEPPLTADHSSPKLPLIKCLRLLISEFDIKDFELQTLSISKSGAYLYKLYARTAKNTRPLLVSFTTTEDRNGMVDLRELNRLRKFFSKHCTPHIQA